MLLSTARAMSTPGEEAGPVDRADWATAAVLHERYLEAIFRYVSRRVVRREEAEDITAEVFAAAFAGLPRFRGECPPPRPAPRIPPGAAQAVP